MALPTDEAVVAASVIFGEAEELAKQLKQKLRDLKPLLTDIATNGNASTLEARMLGTQAEAIGANAEAAVWDLHHQATEIAKARGIDLISIAGGTR
jgi:hypothetical protein